MINKLKTSLLCATAAIAATSSVVHAQDSEVLVMRRAVAPAKEDTSLKPVEGADTNGYYWVTSNWLKGPASCSDEAEQTRLRGCVFQGNQANEENCPQPAPETTRTVADYRSCDYGWVTTVTGGWAETCSETTRPVTSECQRQDGTAVAEIYCAGQSKPTEQKGFNEEGCTYDWVIGDWGDWESECSAETKRKRDVTCNRSNDSVAADTFCEGEKPDTEELGENYSNCTYRWVPTAWTPEEESCGGTVRQTRTAVCTRTDGEEGDPTLCLDPKPELEQEAPDYSACSYSWETGEWGDWNSQCSTSAKRSRSISCKREDGENASHSNCNPQDAPSKEETSEILSGCGYEWTTGEWSDVKACSPAAESTRVVQCRRTDGTVVSEEFCDENSRPSSTKQTPNYENCSYSWQTGNITWDSSCSDAANGTRSVKCVRSDGEDAEDYQCVVSERPDENLVEERYSSCPTYWAEGEWSDWSSQCSANSKKSRTVSCMQEQPTQTVPVSTTTCDPEERPIGEEISSIWSGCVAEWKEGSWGWNGTAGAKSSTCSASPKQERSVVCQKRVAPDGEIQILDDSQCSETKPQTQNTLQSDYSGCTYEWNPGPWGDWDSLCSETARRTRVTQCIRRDGNDTIVSSSNCDPSHEDAETEQIEQVVIDCGGLLKNHDFESGLSEWNPSSTATTTTEHVYSGDQAAYLADGNANLRQEIFKSVSAGSVLNVDFYCKKLSSYNIILHIESPGRDLFGYETLSCGTSSFTNKRYSYPVNGNIDQITVRFYGKGTGTKYQTVIDKVSITLSE